MKYNLHPLKNINIVYFNNCHNCTKCCDGSRFLFAPLFLSDIQQTAAFFPLVFIRFEKEYKLVYLLSDTTPCRYLHKGRCLIYNDRPHACKTYPFMLFQNELYLDFNCEGVGMQGQVIATSTQYEQSFYHPRLRNWQQKQKRTKHFIHRQSGFKKLGKLEGITLYKGVGESIYHQMMQRSLHHLKAYKRFISYT